MRLTSVRVAPGARVSSVDAMGRLIRTFPSASSNFTVTRSGAPLAVPRLARVTVTSRAFSPSSLGVNPTSVTASHGAGAAINPARGVLSGVTRSIATMTAAARIAPPNTTQTAARNLPRRDLLPAICLPDAAVIPLRRS